VTWDPDFWYNIDNVWIFYECNISELIDPADKRVESKTIYKEIRLGDTLYDIITQPTFVMPQIPVFTVIAKDASIVKNYYS